MKGLERRKSPRDAIKKKLGKFDQCETDTAPSKPGGEYETNSDDEAESPTSRGSARPILLSRSAVSPNEDCCPSSQPKRTVELLSMETCALPVVDL